METALQACGETPVFITVFLKQYCIFRKKNVRHVFLAFLADTSYASTAILYELYSNFTKCILPITRAYASIN